MEIHLGSIRLTLESVLAVPRGVETKPYSMESVDHKL
jgi:hypothetical protein